MLDANLGLWEQRRRSAGYFARELLTVLGKYLQLFSSICHPAPAAAIKQQLGRRIFSVTSDRFQCGVSDCMNWSTESSAGYELNMHAHKVWWRILPWTSVWHDVSQTADGDHVWLHPQCPRCGAWCGDRASVGLIINPCPEYCGCRKWEHITIHMFYSGPQRRISEEPWVIIIVMAGATNQTQSIRGHKP